MFLLLHARAVAQVFEEMELCDCNTWQVTESGTPYIKHGEIATQIPDQLGDTIGLSEQL